MFSHSFVIRMPQQRKRAGGGNRNTASVFLLPVNLLSTMTTAVQEAGESSIVAENRGALTQKVFSRSLPTLATAGEGVNLFPPVCVYAHSRKIEQYALRKPIFPDHPITSVAHRFVRRECHNNKRGKYWLTSPWNSPQPKPMQMDVNGLVPAQHQQRERCGRMRTCL